MINQLKYKELRVESGVVLFNNEVNAVAGNSLYRRIALRNLLT
jgi:hypothetical protein